jgi:HD-like signal output (HDOD) protein
MNAPARGLPSMIEAAAACLPPLSFPPVLRKVRLMASEPSCPAPILAGVVGSDPLLATVILGRARLLEDPSLGDMDAIIPAVTRLGLAGVLALLDEVQPVPATLTNYLPSLWGHCNASASLCRHLGRQARHQACVGLNPDTLHSMGLLTETGSILAMILFGDRYAAAGRRALAGEHPLRRLLAEELGVHPAHLAARFIQRRGVSPRIWAAIAASADPLSLGDEGLRAQGCLLALARDLAIGLGFRAGLDQWIEAIDQPRLDAVGLSTTALRAAINDHLEEQDELELYEGSPGSA